MTEKISLLGRKTYKVSDRVVVNIPTVGLTRGENAEDESEFWSEVSLFTVSSYDMVCELDDIGIDFSTMSDYSLFVMLFSAQRDYRLEKGSRDLLFAGIDLWELRLEQDNGKIVLVDCDGNIVIDEDIYNAVSRLVVYMTGHKKPKRRKFGNEITKKRWIEGERRHKKNMNKKPKSDNEGGVLDGIILRLVCNANFPYNFETVNDVTLFDLIYSLKQIDKDSSVTDLMQNRLVGVDLKKYSEEQLSRYVL